jgi:hypothetical protein
MGPCIRTPCFARPAEIDGKPGIYCIQCERVVTPQLFGNTEEVTELTEYREEPDPNAWEGSEKKLVEAIRRAVEARGGTVFRIAQRGGLGSGTDKGCSDTFISIASDKALYRSIEIKPKGKPLTPEQKENVRKGVMFVARSVERALSLCGYE